MCLGPGTRLLSSFCVSGCSASINRAIRTRYSEILFCDLCFPACFQSLFLHFKKVRVLINEHDFGRKITYSVDLLPDYLFLVTMFQPSKLLPTIKKMILPPRHRFNKHKNIQFSCCVRYGLRAKM